MAKASMVAGATSQSVTVFVQDSSSTTGAGLTGLAYNTANLVAYYTFTGANAGAVAITLATLAAVNSAYASGGFKEIDSTNMPGLYRLDLPNAALATSKGQLVTVYLKGATNMAPCLLEIELTGWNNQDAVRGGMTALPNANAGANGGVPTVDSANGVKVSVGTGTGQLNASSGKVPATLAATDVTGNLAADLQTIKTQTVTCAGGVTVPAATLASTTNITSASGITVATNGDKTGYSLTQSFPTNFASLAITAGGLVSIQSNLKKNVALSHFLFLMTDSTTHAPKTGLTVSATLDKDGGGYGATTNSPTEVGNGIYAIDLVQAEMNANVLGLRFTATGADDLNLTLVTTP